MQYAPMGRTGVQVSKIALGTATFGVAPQIGDAERIVAAALDFGINYFDCANSYGNQTRFDRPGVPPAAERESAEEILGRALKGRRNEVIISSKVSEPVGEGVNDRGLSRLHIFNQVEQSLKRLGTDHIDLYYAHHPDPRTPIEATMRAYDDLIRQGKIRYAALSTYLGWQVVDAVFASYRIGAQAPVVNQIAYNLQHRYAEREILPACANHGLSVTVFGPLAGGLFAGAVDEGREITGNRRWGGPGFNDQQAALARQLAQVARDSGHTSPELALAWLLANPVVCSAIIGPETLAELQMNAGAADLTLSPEVMAAVDEVGKQPPIPFN